MTKFHVAGASAVFACLVWLGHEESTRTHSAAALEWPPTVSIQILGAVVRPGTVQLAPGDTFARALERAGGAAPYAKLEAAFLVRESATTHRRGQRLDLSREFISPAPRTGDCVYVPEWLGFSQR